MPLPTDVAELVDALVGAVDAARTDEIDRLRSALVPFGAVDRFDAELRLNGVTSTALGFALGIEVPY